jgi:N-acetylmuramoyl-L-alanine amidase
MNLKIGLKLEKELIKSGAKVVVTRDGDYDLSSPNTDRRKKSDFDNRIRLINGSQAQMYVSIHLNYLLLTQYYGAQVFYDEVFEKNIEIAKTMQEVLNNNTRSRRVIKKIPSTNYLYARLKVPGVLIECGFLSNYNERVKLQKEDYQQKLAEIITKGIVKSI